MKTIVIIGIIILSFQFCFSQSNMDCQLGSAELDTIEVTYLKSAFVPSQNTPIKYVKVNFHYMLKTDGSGNFTESDDGDGNSSFNGYMHAMNIVEAANTKFSNNRQMYLPPGNSTDNPPIQIRLILQGVYFHDSSNTHYDFDIVSGITLNSYYGIANSCNVYIMGSSSSPKGIKGKATLGGFRYAMTKDLWDIYQNNGFENIGADNIIHELCHNFGLIHTIRQGDGDCCDGSPNQAYCDDDCNDTPTWEYIVNTLGEDDPCCWQGDECSNNIMDYTADRQALTPCQLGIAHETIEEFMADYLLRSHTSNITVCDIGYPNVTHIGKNVTISGTSCTSQPVKIEDNENITILYNESVTINSQFEVELGGELLIDSYDIL